MTPRLLTSAACRAGVEPNCLIPVVVVVVVVVAAVRPANLRAFILIVLAIVVVYHTIHDSQPRSLIVCGIAIRGEKGIQIQNIHSK